MLFGERFYEGEICILSPEHVGPVVQPGKTSPSRGEDHRFKSGPAHTSDFDLRPSWINYFYLVFFEFFWRYVFLDFGWWMNSLPGRVIFEVL